MLPPRPQPSHTSTSPHRPSKPRTSTTAELPLINRPLCHSPLTLNPLDHSIKLRFDHYTAHNHFAQRGMQCLKIEDEVQLAHVFEEPIERLYEDLN